VDDIEHLDRDDPDLIDQDIVRMLNGFARVGEPTPSIHVRMMG